MVNVCKYGKKESTFRTIAFSLNVNQMNRRTLFSAAITLHSVEYSKGIHFLNLWTKYFV